MDFSLILCGEKNFYRTVIFANCFFGRCLDDAVGLATELLKVALHVSRKRSIFTNGFLFAFSKFEEGVLREITIYHKEGDALFIVEHTTENLGKGAFTDSSFLRGEAEK